MGSAASLEARLLKRFEQVVLAKAPDGLESVEVLNLHDCELEGVEAANALGRVLGDRCHALLTLNFQGVDLGEPEILDSFGMGVGFGGFPQLKSLILAECELNSEHATQALGHLLRETCPLLDALDLQGNQFGAEGVLSALVTTLDKRGLRRLRTLNLARCGLNSADAAASVGRLLVLLRRSLTELILADNPLGEDSVTRALFEAFAADERLQCLASLDMKRCGMSSAGSAAWLARFLAEKCACAKVFNVGMEGCRSMAIEESMARATGSFTALQRGFGEVCFASLSELQLWDCVIGSQTDAESLGRILATSCPALEVLNLSGSNLGSAPLLDALAAGLGAAQLSRLSTLWLEECGLDSAPAAHSLGHLLRHKTPALKDLRLSYNGLGGHGILMVFSVSLGRGLPALERLDLRNNDVDTTEAGIRRLLPGCPVLKDVWGCRQVSSAYE